MDQLEGVLACVTDARYFRERKRHFIINYPVLGLDNDLGQGAKGRCP